MKTKARRWVLEALIDITRTLPFVIRGIDCDNGGEFINEELLAYCRTHTITFTRSRPYRKNDSCYVEQKNYSLVRRSVGYDRLDTEHERLTLVHLYKALGPFTNFFQPVMRLKRKLRSGSRVRKLYDEPQTPYQRLLLHPKLDPMVKQHLRQRYAHLNPAALRRTIADAQRKLNTLVHHKKHRKAKPPFESIFA